MTYLPNARGSYYVDGQFSDSSDRILKGANVFFLDSGTGLATEMDAVTCVVADSDGVTQYTLTSVSTPAIQLESPSNVYYIEEIDVTSFIDGDITLTWMGEYDGYEYEDVHTVAFDSAPDMIFIEGSTDTLEDSDVVLGQAKTFTCPLRDSANNVVDGYAVRGVFYDRNTATVKERVDATLKAVGTGYWYISHTLNSTTYSADLDRYEFYWQFQSTSGGAWYEVKNSRRALKIYSEVTDVQVGPLSYSTNAVIRQTFPGIDKFLEDVVPNQGEREIMLNRKRQEASFIIRDSIKNTRSRIKRELLEMWEAYEVYRLVLMDAHAFAKFAVEDGQLKLIDKQILRIRNAIFGSISTIRKGGRA